MDTKFSLSSPTESLSMKLILWQWQLWIQACSKYAQFLVSSYMKKKKIEGIQWEFSKKSRVYYWTFVGNLWCWNLGTSIVVTGSHNDKLPWHINQVMHRNIELSCSIIYTSEGLIVGWEMVSHGHLATLYLVRVTTIFWSSQLHACCVHDTS